MGLTAVRAALCSFLQSKRVCKLVLDCTNEAEQLKHKGYSDHNKANIGHAMDPCKSIHEIGMRGLVYHILIEAFNWYGQNFKKFIQVWHKSYQPYLIPFISIWLYQFFKKILNPNFFRRQLALVSSHADKKFRISIDERSCNNEGGNLYPLWWLLSAVCDWQCNKAQP